MTFTPDSTAATIASVYALSVLASGSPRYVPIPSEESHSPCCSRKCPAAARPANRAAYFVVPSLVANVIIASPLVEGAIICEARSGQDERNTCGCPAEERRWEPPRGLPASWYHTAPYPSTRVAIPSGARDLLLVSARAKNRSFAPLGMTMFSAWAFGFPPRTLPRAGPEGASRRAGCGDRATRCCGARWPRPG